MKRIFALSTVVVCLLFTNLNSPLFTALSQYFPTTAWTSDSNPQPYDQTGPIIVP